MLLTHPFDMSMRTTKGPDANCETFEQVGLRCLWSEVRQVPKRAKESM